DPMNFDMPLFVPDLSWKSPPNSALNMERTREFEQDIPIQLAPLVYSRISALRSNRRPPPEPSGRVHREDVQHGEQAHDANQIDRVRRAAHGASDVRQRSSRPANRIRHAQRSRSRLWRNVQLLGSQLQRNRQYVRRLRSALGRSRRPD